MPLQLPPTYRPRPQPSREWGPPPAAEPMPPVVNGPMVGAAVVVSFALVAGIVAWITTHPSKTPPDVTAMPSAPLPSAEPLVLVSQPVWEVIVPAVHHAPSQDVLVDRVAPCATPPALPSPRQPERVRIAEAPPPQPKNAPPKGETYGTSVLFLNNPVEAAETARRESKLLFVLHVSGNFEDSCFT
jgi:hypothetical protein